MGDTEQEKAITRRNIQNEIYYRTNQINQLSPKLTLYKNMKTQVNQAIPTLRRAGANITDAKYGLKSTYTSEVAKKKDTELDNIIQKNKDSISTLNDKILPAINTKISSLNSQIQGHRDAIKRLKTRLYYL